MTHKIRIVGVEEYAYYVNKRRQNVGLETWKWRQIVTSQTAHTKCKWPPYDSEPNPPPWKFSAYATVYYTQRQVSASLWNARAYSRSSYIQSVGYTNTTLLLTWRLQSWHKGNCTTSAHHQSLWETAQCESHPVRGAQAVGASLRDFPLTWRRNTQIQMY